MVVVAQATAGAVSPFEVLWRLPLAMADMIEAQGARRDGVDLIERGRDWGKALEILNRGTGSTNGVAQ